MMKEMNLHTYLAREQPENKCFTDSSILQNLQHLSPCQFLLIKLSLVRITFSIINHMNFLF